MTVAGQWFPNVRLQRWDVLLYICGLVDAPTCWYVVFHTSFHVVPHNIDICQTRAGNDKSQWLFLYIGFTLTGHSQKCDYKWLTPPSFHSQCCEPNSTLEWFKLHGHLIMCCCDWLPALLFGSMMKELVTIKNEKWPQGLFVSRSNIW